MKFTKMQGLGNDYIYINAFEERVDDPPALARRLSDRHFGVGGDGLVLIAPSDKADFRMIMMHHPVSDAYTKRYIPDVIEPGKVDLMLSGHTHSYARAVSSNPEVGAGTIYLTHQDARTYNKKGDFFYITRDKGSDVLKVENYGATGEGAESKLANTTLVAKEKQQLKWSDISIEPTEVLYNGEVTVKATVTNVGKGLAAAVIPVDDNGKTRYLYEFEDGIVTLDPGKSATLSLASIR